ncbi:MAG: NIL domain-containing protein, partial [Candidatus Methanomethylophilaceae archaeon]
MLKFTTSNFQEPISYELVKRFNIVPNIMQAKVNESGGGLILDL